jgi:hypothetical protein
VTLRNALAGMPLLCALLASAPVPLHAQNAKSGQLVTPFSAAQPGARLPTGWIPLSFGSNKPPTEYKFVEDGGQVVLHARAVAATGALLHPVNFQVRSAPVLRWRWKISQVIAEADNSIASKEDSPARIVLGFDGDRSRLTTRDRAASALAKGASGRALPYAQLIYIWSTKAPVGSVIQHPHSPRVRMVVAASGSANAGKWVTLSRNVYDDFKRAFGEEPGPLTDVGVLTDSDNTGASVEAWYGDIHFAR